MKLYHIARFLHRKCRFNGTLHTSPELRHEPANEGWGDGVEKYSFIVVKEGQGYNVTIQPVELA